MPLASSEGVRGVMSAASAGVLLVLLVGISMMAGEFRHNTATPTFLITPDRRRVVGGEARRREHRRHRRRGGRLGAHPRVALPWLAARDVEVGLLSRDVASRC